MRGLLLLLRRRGKGVGERCLAGDGPQRRRQPLLFSLLRGGVQKDQLVDGTANAATVKPSTSRCCCCSTATYAGADGRPKAPATDNTAAYAGLLLLLPLL